ncbi:ABC transporter permease [Maribacter stanieri]|uniref:ABC transporter permease n=1 Tax=Maribacter stanieri TaxID=440514 RepID=UPI002494C7D5|nr:ABC transporter permease [Maribacter stanieri]
MFKNYLKIAWRNLKVNRLFSAINVLGLSIGLAVTLILFIFIRHEQSFDTMYTNADNIQRVLLHTDGDNGQEIWATVPPSLGPTMMTDVANVEYAARILKNDFGGTASLRVLEQNFTEKDLFWVDAELLNIFDVTFIKGQAKGALDRPNTAVLSETSAKQYFGAIDPIGKTFTVDGKYELEVTGVYKDFPNNSTLDCNIMASGITTWFFKNPSWYNASFETYCLLKPNTDLASTELQLQEMLNKNMEKENQWYTFSLQPMKKVHLYSAGYDNAYANRIGDIKEVRNLSYLALLILLIASINYMNLTTARSQKRSKEVGISKTLGSSSGSLLFRFYMETGLVTLISLIIGVLLTFTALPIFNSLTGQELSTDSLLNVEFFISLFVLWLVVTLISGSYPALYLSQFKPSIVLKSSIVQSKGNVFIRKGLVVFQFAASVVLIVGVLMISKQMEFIRNQKLGFNAENVVAISINGLKGSEKKDALVSELKGLSNVSSVSLAQGFPGMEVSGRSLSRNEDDKEKLNIQTNVTDASVIDVLQLKLLAGRTLPSFKQEKDTLVEVVLNRKAIEYLGYSPEEAIGKKVHISVPNTIVGVVDDFNFASLHEPIGAYAFHNNTGEGKSFALVRYNAAGNSSTINQLETIFKAVAPNAAFNYSFLDNNLQNLYVRERRTAKVGIIFSVLAIFIACLGLFGLAAFVGEQRKKEIGIRKVLGASIVGITQMLSKDFVKLVFIAMLIAFPIAYWLMDRWLSNFAFHIDMSYSVFVIAGISALVIALVTVSFQSVRSALSNPVKSLRSE